VDGRLNRILAVAANTHREAVRERVLYNLVFFALLMILSGLLMRQLSIRQDEKIIKDIALASMELFGTLIGIFIGVGLMSKEVDRRSLYPLLAKPLGRGEFIVGKFLGLGFTLLVNIAVMAAGMYATLLATSGRFDARLLPAVYAIYLSLLLVVAVALLFSTLTSAALAAVCAVCLVVVGRYSDVIRNMRDVLHDAPGWLASGLYFVIPNFRDFDLKDRVVYGQPVSAADLGLLTLYTALYVGVCLTLCLMAFRRRDLP